MSEYDITQINDRLTRLEVQMTEKWEAHDRRAAERWTDLMDKFHELTKKMDNRACVAHGELLTAMHHRTKALEDWKNIINWALGVVYVALVGAIIKMLV